MTKFIEPYNQNWKIEFEEIKQIIESELSDFGGQFDIQHVGSTSIPGLFAKPILDIDIIINNKELLIDIVSRLEKIGYSYKGDQGIPGRFAFRQIAGFVPMTAKKQKWLSHHLYVCYADSLALKNHILFRNLLRKDKYLSEKYSELKKSLTDNLKITSEKYTNRKTDFIISVLATAGLDAKELEEITKANT